MTFWEILAAWYAQQSSGFEAAFEDSEAVSLNASGQIGSTDLGGPTTIALDFDGGTHDTGSVTATVNGWTGFTPVLNGGIELDNSMSTGLAEFHYFFRASAGRFLSAENYRVTPHIVALGVFDTLSTATTNNMFTSPDARVAFARCSILARTEVLDGETQVGQDGATIFRETTSPPTNTDRHIIDIDSDIPPVDFNVSGESDVVIQVILALLGEAQGNANRVVVSGLDGNPGFQLRVTGVSVRGLI